MLLATAYGRALQISRSITPLAGCCLVHQLMVFPQIKPEEQKALVDILNNSGGAVEKAHSDGVYVTGIRFVVTKIEDRSLYGRQV